jgi:hypothetical protein
VQDIADKTFGDLAQLAVVLAVVDPDRRRAPLEALGGRQVDAVVAPVEPVLVLVPLELPGHRCAPARWSICSYDLNGFQVDFESAGRASQFVGWDTLTTEVIE